MRIKKLVISVLVVFAIVICIIPFNKDVYGAEIHPSKPKISLKRVPEGGGIIVTVSKTKNADGYELFVKMAGEKDYVSYGYIEKDGTSKRQYTINNLSAGKYSVKVKAYHNDGYVYYLSNFSKVKSISIKAKTMEVADCSEILEKYYPELKKLTDSKKIVVGADCDSREYITLGRWIMDCPQYNDDWNLVNVRNSEQEDEPIEWEVLDYSKDGKKALVISRYIITAMKFDDEGEPDVKYDRGYYNEHLYYGATWVDSSLRKWLNNDFYYGAFTKEERELIQKSTIKTDKKDTKDFIFLLSDDETEEYYHKDKALGYFERIATYKNGIEDDWWLRTQGYESGLTDIESEGRTDEIGQYGLYEYGVRPAFWITLTPEIIENNKLSIGGYSGKKVDKDDIYVVLGHFDYQDASGYRLGNEIPMKWRILDYDPDNGKVLLVSDYILMDKPFNDQWDFIVWEESTIRKWLNEDFYKKSFSSEEKKLILKTKIKNAKNDIYGTGSGKDTSDRIFLLSLAEVDKYFDGHRSLRNHVASLKYYNEANGRCWLRTAGEYSSNAVTFGSYTLLEGESLYIERGVLPALWLSLKEVED